MTDSENQIAGGPMHLNGGSDAILEIGPKTTLQNQFVSKADLNSQYQRDTFFLQIIK